MKIQPQNIEAEESIICCCIIDKNAFPLCKSIITKEAFYKESNKIIFTACEQLFDANEPIDLLTISNLLIKTKKGKISALDFIGGLHVLAGITDRVASSINLDYYCRIVNECFMRRHLIAVSGDNLEKGYDLTFDIFDTLDKSKLELARMTEQISKKKSTNVFDIVRNILFQNDDESKKEIKSGISAFDDFVKISGGDLVVIAGRPGMGKTSIGVTMMANLSTNGKKGMFFSLEMPEKSIVQKYLSVITNVPYWKIREKQYDSFELSLLHECYSTMKEANIRSLIDDSSSLSVEQIKAKAITEHMKEPIDFIMVDYIQFVKPSEAYKSNRDQQVGHITYSLKMLAKELDIPVIAFAQLSRAVELRVDKKPQLSDLRESGNIEQDADIVIFTYRPEYYQIMEDANGISTVNKAELIIGKNRHGGCGSIQVNCDMAVGKFW